MTDTWERLQGVSLAGVYGLDEWLGSDPTGAFFMSRGPDGERAIVKVVEADPSTAARQLALWERTAQLSHTHLLRLLDCGRSDSPEGSFLYAAFEAPDDSLADAVRRGPVGEDEAGELFRAALQALDFLHAHGWAHTAIDVDHVVAVGDRIKLTTDTLQEAHEDESAQSQDIWAIGALVYELLTERHLDPGRLAGVSGISESLAAMIQNATEPDAELRWTAAQLLQTFMPASEPVVSEPAVSEPDPDAPESIATEPTQEPLFPVEDPASEDAPDLRRPPIVVHEPFSAVESEEPVTEPLSPPEPTFARYVPIASIGLVALLALVFVFAHHGASPTPAVAIVPPPPAAEPASAAPVTAAKAEPRNWRVISYTYFRKEDADKKAQSINHKVSGIHAEVFTLGTKPPSYLISLGAHLTKDEAAALRRKALAKGLPRETFIRNFAE